MGNCNQASYQEDTHVHTCGNIYIPPDGNLNEGIIIHYNYIKLTEYSHLIIYYSDVVYRVLTFLIELGVMHSPLGSMVWNG